MKSPHLELSWALLCAPLPLTDFDLYPFPIQFSSVQLLSRVRLFSTP